MNLAIFGATGRTGSRALAMALDRGDQASALVRTPGSLTNRPRLGTVVGDARNTADVAQTLERTDAVLCCLGLADISQPTTHFSDSVRAIVEAMQRTGPRRIVAVASAGVLPDPGGGLRLERSSGGPYQHINAEHARNYATLSGSGLAWTILCAVDLKDDIPAGHARTAFEDLPPGSGETGYDDLAATLLAVIGDAATFGKRIGIVSDRPPADNRPLFPSD